MNNQLNKILKQSSPSSYEAGWNVAIVACANRLKKEFYAADVVIEIIKK